MQEVRMRTPHLIIAALAAIALAGCASSSGGGGGGGGGMPLEIWIVMIEPGTV
jgi:hypothetical protein